MKRLIALLTALIIGMPSWASITVSPTKIEINANKLRNNYVTSSIEIKGGDSVTRYRVYPGYFTITENGQMAMSEDKNDPHNISDKVRFVPSEFTVSPGKSQRLRVNIANIKSLPDGESRAILYLEDVNVKEVNVPNNVGIGAQLVLKTRVGIPVYVDKGNFTKKGDIESLNVVKGDDGLYTEMKVASLGNSKIRYTGTFQVIQGKKLIEEYSVDGNVVAGGKTLTTRQKIRTDNIKGVGDYTIRVIISYSDENGNRKNVKKETILKITGEKI